jgi:hypothetical protein
MPSGKKGGKPPSRRSKSLDPAVEALVSPVDNKPKMTTRGDARKAAKPSEEAKADGLNA